MNTPLTSAANLPQAPTDVEIGTARVVTNTNTTVTAPKNPLTLAKYCGITIAILISISIIAACLFISWIPYIIWKYSNNPLDIAITTSVWLACSIFIVLVKLILATPESMAKKSDIMRALEAWSMMVTGGLLTPAIVYSWLYYAIQQASYNIIVGKVLLAYSIIETVILLVYTIGTMTLSISI